MIGPTHARQILLLAFLIVLTACSGTAAPEASPTPVAATPTLALPAPATAVPTSPPAPTVAPTTVPTTAPTTPPTSAPPVATPSPSPVTGGSVPAPPTAAGGSGISGVFVVPTAVPTPVPGIVALPAVLDQNGPNYQAEVTAFFQRFYQARTLLPGSRFDLATSTNLVATPYQDYTLPLLQQNQAEADAGKLTQVTYTDVAVQSVDALPGGTPNLTFVANITRTQHVQRPAGSDAPQTLSLQFRLRRTPLPNNQVNWQAYDFFNPATSAWVSESLASIQVSPEQLQRELVDFFARFYGARSLSPGGQFDLATTEELTQFAYQAYTLPLLQQQQDEATTGRLKAVSYTDIAIRVEQWDPRATSHGGIATVAVTRTSHVQEAGKPEDTQTATYEFRVHRHLGDDGNPFWIAVDFLSPITQKWVSDSAGLSGPIPPAGHG